MDQVLRPQLYPSIHRFRNGLIRSLDGSVGGPRPGFAHLSFCRSLHIQFGVLCLRGTALRFRLVGLLRRGGRDIQRVLVCLQFLGSVGQLIKFAAGYKFSGTFRHPVNPIFSAMAISSFLESGIWGSCSMDCTRAREALIRPICSCCASS